MPEAEVRTATITLWLVSHWNPYKGDGGAWDLEIEYWKPSETDTKVLLEEFTVERSTEFSHEQLVGLQLEQYDKTEAYKEVELGKDKVLLNNLRQELLAITHQPEPPAEAEVDVDDLPF